MLRSGTKRQGEEKVSSDNKAIRDTYMTKLAITSDVTSQRSTNLTSQSTPGRGRESTIAEKVIRDEKSPNEVRRVTV